MKLLLKAQYGQILEEKKHKAHLFNLNFDPQLSGRLVHIFQVKSCWFTSMFDSVHIEVGHLRIRASANATLTLLLQKDNTEIGNTKGKESDICMVGPG